MKKSRNALSASKRHNDRMTDTYFMGVSVCISVSICISYCVYLSLSLYYVQQYQYVCISLYVSIAVLVSMYMYISYYKNLTHLLNIPIEGALLILLYTLYTQLLLYTVYGRQRGGNMHTHIYFLTHPVIMSLCHSRTLPDK